MNDDPTELLKKHGKTFNFARLFLGSKTGLAAARLYRFCRIVDDIADESPNPDIAKVKLNSLKESIIHNTPDHPVVKDFLVLCEEYQIDYKFIDNQEFLQTHKNNLIVNVFDKGGLSMENRDNSTPIIESYNAFVVKMKLALLSNCGFANYDINANNT